MNITNVIIKQKTLQFSNFLLTTPENPALKLVKQLEFSQKPVKLGMGREI